MTAPKQWTSIMAQIKNAGSYQPEAVEHVIDTLLSQSEMSQWVIGDILNMTSASDEHLERLAKMAGVQVKTLESYARTAETWTWDLRWELLDVHDWIKYSHMKCLVPIANDPKFGLRIAIDAIYEASNNLMTIRELRRYIAVEIRGNKPKPKLKKVAKFKSDVRDYDYWGECISIPGDKLEVGKTYLFEVYEVGSDS